MRVFLPEPIIEILTTLSASERRTAAHFVRRPRTGKTATSAITRLYVKKLRRKMDRRGYVRP